jgi:hypothetical protein
MRRRAVTLPRFPPAERFSEEVVALVRAGREGHFAAALLPYLTVVVTLVRRKKPRSGGFPVRAAGTGEKLLV